MRLKLLLRIILTILVIIVVIIGGLFGLNAYSEVEVVDKEKDFYIYHYNQTGYTKDGKAKNIDYTASKKLKQHHYLVVSEKSHTITSYKEVKQSDIPTKAKEKL